jgi:hypothetical protein
MESGNIWKVVEEQFRQTSPVGSSSFLLGPPSLVPRDITSAMRCNSLTVVSVLYTLSTIRGEPRLLDGHGEGV